MSICAHAQKPRCENRSPRLKKDEALAASASTLRRYFRRRRRGASCSFLRAFTVVNPVLEVVHCSPRSSLGQPFRLALEARVAVGVPSVERAVLSFFGDFAPSYGAYFRRKKSSPVGLPLETTWSMIGCRPPVRGPGSRAQRGSHGVVKIYGSGQILAEPLGLRLTLRLSPGHTDRAAPESHGLCRSAPVFQPPYCVCIRLLPSTLLRLVRPCSGTGQKKARAPCRD